MDKYYKILGVDELTSKPLIKIAYAYALNYAREEQIEDSKMLDIHLAYQLLRRYRLRFRKWIKKGMKAEEDQKLQEIITDTKNQIAKRRIDTLLYTSKLSLEIGYCIRTMLLGVFPVLLFIFSEGLIVDFLRLTKDARDFLASLIFYFSIFNLFFNWIEPYYSFLLIIAAFGLVLWRLKSFERKVIKTIKKHLN